MYVRRKLPYRVICHEQIWIPMRDGARLSGRLWLPRCNDPTPAILEYIPYRHRDLTRRRDDMNHRYLAGHGYACLRVDLRGSGNSDGVLVDQYREQEQLDGEDVIAWMAEQSWCDGNVGMLGISWGGFNALQIAARRPPALRAIVSVCSTDDLYRDNMHYMGGCLLSDNLSEATTMFAYNACPPDPMAVGKRWRELWLQRLRGSGMWLQDWLRHQRRDAYWQHGSICEDYQAIRCPVLLAGGWADGFTNAIFRMLQHLGTPTRALIGPWSHRYPHLGVPGPAIGFLQEVVRWFDHWCKNDESVRPDDAKLRVWMQDSVPPYTRYQDRPGRWVAESDWPSPRISTHRLLLTPGCLHEEEKVAERRELLLQSPLSVGLFAGKWCSYAGPPDLPADQRLEDGGALVFDSEPLDEPLEILGLPTCELELRSDQPVAMIAARLSDVRPDGAVTRVTYGICNLCHRDGHAKPEQLEPGRRYRISLQLNGIAQRFPAGHRIRLALSTSYWPLAWPSPRTARLHVLTGTSLLMLPYREPHQDDDLQRPFLHPEGAAPSHQQVLQADRANWIVHHELESGTSSLEVVRDDGAWHIPSIDLTVRRKTLEWYDAVGNDPTSVRGETRTSRGFARGDWQVHHETRTVLSSDADSFHLHAELDAFEANQRVYSETWDERIERDHC